jgi:DNA-binding transcriptional LysR family regulator
MFEDLKLFKDIAHCRSLSRGAGHAGISQSAASQHVAELEKRLGVPLLDRSTRPLSLTTAGRLYLELCKDVLRREEQFQAELEQLKIEVEGAVRVASIYSVGLSEMSQLQERFSLRFPKAFLHVQYHRPEKVYEAVIEDQADLGLVSYPEPSREVAVIPWREEQMTLAVAPGNPLASKAVIEPADLDGVDFVGFEEGLRIRRELDRFFREHGIEVRFAMSFDNIQMIKEAVTLGSGVSILPSRTMQAEIEQGRLVSVPLNAPELVRPVGVIHRKRKHFNRAAQSFLRLLEQQPAADPVLSPA